jgi:glutathione S-transferase
MAESITLYSFGDVDRSGKVRWLAAELGLEVVEDRVELGAQRKPAYLALNPLGQIPTVVFRGEVLVESTAACHTLAEAFDTPRLWIGRGEPRRRAYLYWLSAFAETCEGRLVECAVSKAGILGPEYFALHERTLRRKLRVLADQLPSQGHLCGDGLTVADVVAGYNLRLAVQTGLLERERAEPYLSRLVQRPAAQASRVFAGLG